MGVRIHHVQMGWVQGASVLATGGLKSLKPG